MAPGNTAADIAERAAASVAQPVETLEQYVSRMVKDNPKGVVNGGELFAPDTPVPGLKKFTLEMAQVCEATWEQLAILVDASKYYQASLVRTCWGPHIIRGFSRQEWSELQAKVMADAQARAKAHAENKTDTDWMREDLRMRAEEMIACAGCVAPPYDAASIRQIPAGVPTILHDSIVQVSGHEANPLPPLRLE